MSSKIDLFEDSWLNTIFEGRNKSYGAYELRRTSGKTLLIALLIGSLLFGSVVAIPFVKNLLEKALSSKEEEKITKVELKNIETPKEEKKEEIIETKVEEVKQTKSIVDVVKFVPPVIVDKKVVETEMKSVDDFKDKKTGATDVKASDDADADLNLDGSDSNKKVDADLTDYSQRFENVQIEAQPAGGINAFRKKIADYLGDEFADLEESVTGTVTLQFYVMSDGSLDDFTILKEDPKGYKLAEKSIKFVKKQPKWTPGIQNGRNVSSRKVLPLKFILGNN